MPAKMAATRRDPGGGFLAPGFPLPVPTETATAATTAAAATRPASVHLCVRNACRPRLRLLRRQLAPVAVEGPTHLRVAALLAGRHVQLLPQLGELPGALSPQRRELLQ